MKVILSRKGFDSAFGGYPSPVLPDGRMISLPIPSDDFIRYANLMLDEKRSYYDLMKELKPTIKVNNKWIELTKDSVCHLDPDINEKVIYRLPGWKPIFGQTGGAQTHLINQEVGIGDIFLFFGWFRQTKALNGKIVFDPEVRDKHIIFGYLQIGEIIKVRERKDYAEWMKYHPHIKFYQERESNNTVYIARDKLSWDESIPGAGTFNYHKDLILTKEGYSRSCWDLPDCLRNVKISHHTKKSWKKNHFKSVARGQEFVIDDDEKVTEWVKELMASTIEKQEQIGV